MTYAEYDNGDNMTKEIPKNEDVHYGTYEEESLTEEEARSKIAMMLSRTENLETLSETDDAEVKLISALKTIAERYNMPLVDDYTDKYLQLKVSLHRQGRKEIQEIARPSHDTEERQKSSLKSLLLGGIR